MNLKGTVRSLGHIALSVTSAGVLYSVWLVIFLLVLPHTGRSFRAFFWMLAPLFTAAGFAVGLAAFQNYPNGPQNDLGRLYVRMIVACALGAVALSCVGPMFIVFGMFIAGTATAAVIELKKHRRHGARPSLPRSGTEQ